MRRQSSRSSPCQVPANSKSEAAVDGRSSGNCPSAVGGSESRSVNRTRRPASSGAWAATSSQVPSNSRSAVSILSPPSLPQFVLTKFRFRVFYGEFVLAIFALRQKSVILSEFVLTKFARGLATEQAILIGINGLPYFTRKGCFPSVVEYFRLEIVDFCFDYIVDVKAACWW